MPQVLKEVIKESVSKISLDVYVDLLSTAPRLAVGLSTFYRAFWQENPAFSFDSAQRSDRSIFSYASSSTLHPRQWVGRSVSKS